MDVKELLRNGSFERGNADFWESVSDDTAITAQTDEKKRGTYGGKIAVSDNLEACAITKDYIPVAVHELYKLTAWLKSAVMDNAAVYVYWYDGDLNYVYSTLLYDAGAVLAAFTEVKEFFQVYTEASYLRIFFYNNKVPPADNSWYVDSASLQRLDMDKLASRRESMAIMDSVTTKATYYFAEFFTGVWKQAEYHLICTSLTGTSPTLDITIQGYDPDTLTWKDVMVFQRLDAAGSEFKTLLSGLGWKQRVKAVLAGTTVTDCDFEVGVVYKR